MTATPGGSAQSVPPAVVINANTLAGSLDRLASCGMQADGGISRHVFTQPWAEGTRVVERLMQEAGLEVRHDAAGNVVGRLPGQDKSSVVLTGSHLDTVHNGGRFDGALGVVAGVAALEALQDVYGEPGITLEVVAFCEEEGGRFHANFLGSRVMLGLVAPDELGALHDDDGITLADAMRSVGLVPERLGEARRSDVSAFLELHIEQGRTLYDGGYDIGVVTAITGISWQLVRVHGQADHAGTTPMGARHDALIAAARMALAVADIALAVGEPAVATVGKWHVRPGGSNIVPGEVVFTIDARHPDEAILAGMIREMARHCGNIADDAGVAVELEQVKLESPTPTDAKMQSVIAEASRAHGVRWRELSSGATHDSQLWARHVPTGMIFVPSVHGRSHSPAEYTGPEDCARGAEILAAALYRLCYT